jgi:geranylgeranyl diphosphate synthase type I
VSGKKTAVLPPLFHRYGAELSAGLRASLSGEGCGVYDTLRYAMGWTDPDGNPVTATNGKALRPTLCLFACEVIGGNTKRAMPAAVAIEFIHNFSLIHDDIQDHDKTRRGRPTVWAVWGEPKAIVSGNALRAVADISLERLVEQGVSISEALHVVAILTEAYLQMIEGQYLDLDYEKRHDVSQDAYLDMISRKTGALIRCSLEMGAFLGTKDAATVDAFRRFGRSLGFVFQIRDDILGVWGEEEKTGKPVGADIRRKKNSFPVVHAMSHAKDTDAALLKETYGKEVLDDQDVVRVLQVMERAGTRDQAQALAQRHCSDALAALEGLPLDSQARQEISELAHFLLVREH